MREFDGDGLDLCKIQACIFEKSIDKASCSSAIFIRRFMNSDVARRMDNTYFLFEATSTDQVFDEIEEEYGKSDYKKVTYNKDELYWMGYIYRYWSFVYEKPSKWVYHVILPKELRLLYEPYHTLDPKACIERIMEQKKIEVEEDLMSKGLRVLRELRSKNK